MSDPETITEAELAEALAVRSGWRSVPCRVDAVELFRIAAERRGAEIDSPGTVPDDTERDPASALGQARPRAGAVPALLVAAAFSFGTETSGSTAISPVNAPGDHAACDVTIARLRERAVAAEARLAELGAFWLVTDEDGDIILSAPCADTLGCLWSACPGGERVTLGELIAAAGTHTGMAAGEMHGSLAVATGETEEGPPNNGNPVIYSGAVAPGGWVCAVPVAGNPDHICGMPVESEPCTEHGQSSTDERGI